jgi:serine/threonine-protein kinase RsbW
MGERVNISVPATPQSVGHLRHVAADFAADHGASTAVQRSVALAVSEAATNAVLHAYRDAEQAGQLHLRASALPDRLEICVSDDGAGMKPRPDSPGMGLGLPVIAQLADDLQVLSEHGTSMVMGFALRPDDA